MSAWKTYLLQNASPLPLKGWEEISVTTPGPRGVTIRGWTL